MGKQAHYDWWVSWILQPILWLAIITQKSVRDGYDADLKLHFTANILITTNKIWLSLKPKKSIQTGFMGQVLVTWLSQHFFQLCQLFG